MGLVPMKFDDNYEDLSSSITINYTGAIASLYRDGHICILNVTIPSGVPQQVGGTIILSTTTKVSALASVVVGSNPCSLGTNGVLRVYNAVTTTIYLQIVFIS